MYTVKTDDQAKHQVDALPAGALAAYAELRVVVEDQRRVDVLLVLWVG